MRELFGTPPHPIADSIDTGVTPLDAAGDAETNVLDGGRRRRGATMTRTSARRVARAVVVAAGATLAGGLVVGWLGARWTQPEASASATEVRESPVAPSTAPVAPPAGAAVHVPVPARADVAATSAPAPTKPPEGAPEKVRRSSRKRGVAKRRDAATAPADARIFPDSYYERDK
jgi:hypothetical protein